LNLSNPHFKRVYKEIARAHTQSSASGSNIFPGMIVQALVQLPDGRRVDAKCVDLLAFLHDRLKVWLRDQGIRHDVIDACLAMPGNDDLTLLVKRAEALSAVLKTEDGANLLAGFKRANNILTQAEDKDGVEYSYDADPKFAETDSERALFTALDQAEAAETSIKARREGRRPARMTTRVCGLRLAPG
jgi:glycyl-tRNA synthetase beta subunit